MQVSGLSHTFIDADPLEVAKCLLEEFLKVDEHVFFSNLRSYEVKQIEGKYFMVENRRYFDNSTKEIINRELSVEEYKYYLALKTVIKHLEKQSKN